MKKPYILILLISLSASAQEVCVEDINKTLKEDVTSLSHPLISSACKEFGIHDLSILETPKKIHPMVLMHYRQKEPKLSDPIADYHVMDFVDQTINSLKGKKSKNVQDHSFQSAKDCAYILFGLEDKKENLEYTDKNFYKESDQYKSDLLLLEEVLSKYSPEERKKVLDLFESGKLTFESGLSPVNPSRMAKSFIDVIEEEDARGLSMKRGGKHTWSEEFKKNRGTFTSARLKSFGSRILMTLAGGKGDSTLITGKEDELRKFIESVPDQSLIPEELFRKSYQINNGDMYQSLLTVENVLSAQWRNPKREKLTSTAKLKPFSKNFGSHGDVFGHWYHLFGMVFYGSVEGKTRANIVAKAEGLGSQILSKFKGETQENLINDKGGVVGAYLRRYMTAKENGKTYKLPSADKEKKSELKKILERKVKKVLKE